MTKNPETVLDARYSDPAATAAGWDETVRVLEQAELFWLTTVRADGRPHVTPVVAAWGEGAVHFHTGEHGERPDGGARRREGAHGGYPG